MHRYLVSRLDQIDEGRGHTVGRAAVHCGARNDDLIVQHIQQQLDIHELIGEQQSRPCYRIRPAA
jgi:hypothetical protein